MNMRREAMMWSMAVTAAIALGLIVVWGAIALAFGRPNFAPLYFAAAPYRQDDYSAEGVETARLNPLDPSLEQEVIFEDQARGIPVFSANYDLPISPPEPINVPPLEPTNLITPISDKPDNTDIPDKPDNTDKPDKPDNIDKPDKPDNTDKPDKPNKPDRPDKPDRPNKPGKP